MKKTFVSLSILIALLMSLFQPSVAPEEGNGAISTYDLYRPEVEFIEP